MSSIKRKPTFRCGEQRATCKRALSSARLLAQRFQALGSWRKSWFGSLAIPLYRLGSVLGDSEAELARATHEVHREAVPRASTLLVPLPRFDDVLRQPAAPTFVHVPQACHRLSVSGFGSTSVPLDCLCVVPRQPPASVLVHATQVRHRGGVAGVGLPTVQGCRHGLIPHA